MANCSICGERIPEGSRTCSACGTSTDDVVSMTSLGLAEAAPPSPAPAELPVGGSYCPVCVRVYGPEYTDGFCSCGTELLKEIPATGSTGDFEMAPVFDAPSVPTGDLPMAPFLDEDVPMAPVLDDVPMAPFIDETPAVDVSLVSEKPPVVKPAPGLPCMVLYGPDKQPLQYFALAKDTTLIGRLDAVAGNFPDIDLDEWFERSITRKISRQHVLILRSRAAKTFSLRPLVGNTGTQLESDMIAPQQDYPLKPGQRIILGGVIRLKFEIT